MINTDKLQCMVLGMGGNKFCVYASQPGDPDKNTWMMTTNGKWRKAPAFGAGVENLFSLPHGIKP